MVEEMGNIIRNGQYIAEYCIFDNGKAVVAWAPFSEDTMIRSIIVFDSGKDMKSLYSREFFKAIFKRRRQDADTDKKDCPEILKESDCPKDSDCYVCPKIECAGDKNADAGDNDAQLSNSK